MEDIKRKAVLRYIYLNARRRGQKADPLSDDAVYLLNFHLLSIEVRPAEEGFDARIYANMLPSECVVSDEDRLFPYLRLVYKGSQDGIERVLLERFGLTGDGKKDPDDFKLLRFRDSKDGRELADGDCELFDRLLEYCSLHCLTGVVSRSP